MTCESTVSLVLQAFTIGAHGDILVLNMGEPIRANPVFAFWPIHDRVPESRSFIGGTGRRGRCHFYGHLQGVPIF
jgi:hypothetical protein